MEGLTLSAEEQSRLQVLNGVLELYWSIKEVALLLGVSERQGWRLLATSIWVGGLPAALQSAEEVLPEGTRRINLEGRDRNFHP